MSSQPLTATVPPYGYITPSVAMTTVAAPTAPASTSVFAMQGLAAIITPATPSGNVLCLISGTLTDAAVTVGEGIILQIYYGPVLSGAAPPANAAAPPNSAVAIGPTQEWATGVTLTTSALLFQPFCIHAVARALVPGQQVWFDLAAKSVTGASQVAITNAAISLVEVG
jgi:hypothetical protein